MKVTIKITRDKTWTDEKPLEFEIEEARVLYQKLREFFKKEDFESFERRMKNWRDKEQVEFLDKMRVAKFNPYPAGDLEKTYPWPAGERCLHDGEKS